MKMRSVKGMDMQEYHRLDALIQKHLDEISEHVDAAVIMVTFPSGGHSGYIRKTAGNVFACQGLAYDYVDDIKAEKSTPVYVEEDEEGD